MNKIQCSEGHFYDADLYSQCPLCEKMESVGKVNSSKPSKKSLISKKKNQETKNVPEQSENIQRKSSNQPKKKRNAPAAGSVVTVAFYNTGSEDGKQPDNQGKRLK